jgi:hypothetical protein
MVFYLHEPTEIDLNLTAFRGMISTFIGKAGETGIASADGATPQGNSQA